MSLSTSGAAKKVKHSKPSQADQHTNKRSRTDATMERAAAQETLHSIAYGSTMFSHLIGTPNLHEFMTNIWEKTTSFVKRNDPNFYEFLGVSSAAINDMLVSNAVEFTKNLDVTSYENGIRETHNPEGRALPATVWSFFDDGCSIRLLNPQTFMPRLHRLNAALQEYFHCLVGANIYLTPPNSQGFAPHYDDIEAFVLQIEGKKRWRLYRPRSENERLPRVSSGNFSAEEIGECVQDVILEPGDLLYFPRGWIHQANTVPGQRSLHITLSVYQKTSYADLIEELAKKTFKNAFESDVLFREGLPLDIWNEFGAVFSGDRESDRRINIKNRIKGLFHRLIDHIDLDDAVDRMAIKFQHDALPPILSGAEEQRTTYGTKPISKRNGKLEYPEPNPDTEVRLLRARIVRLVNIDNVHQLHYYSDNSKEYHQIDANFLELEDEYSVDIAKRLIRAYPDYVRVSDLCDDDVDEAVTVVRALWGRGLLMTKDAL